MEEKRLQMSESFFLTAILAIVGGFLDSYSYLMRGHVFANAQTGNIVLFGVNLQKRDFTQAFYYFVPILAFAVGVILVEIIKHFYKEEPESEACHIPDTGAGRSGCGGYREKPEGGEQLGQGRRDYSGARRRLDGGFMGV